MTSNDPLDIGQADAGSFKFVCFVKALEHTEELIGIFHVEADSVIADEKDMLAVVIGGTADFNLGASARSAVFESVGKQVEHHLAHEGWVSIYLRKRSNFPNDLPPGRVRKQLINGVAGELFNIK